MWGVRLNLSALIDEIRMRPILWDRTHPSHYNKVLHEPIWDEIATNMKTTREAVKTKWKNLRDAYRKVLKKAIQDGTAVHWIHHEQMQFIKEQTINTRERRRDILYPDVLTDMNVPSVKMEVMDNIDYMGDESIITAGDDEEQKDSGSDSDSIPLGRIKDASNKQQLLKPQNSSETASHETSKIMRLLKDGRVSITPKLTPAPTIIAEPSCSSPPPQIVESTSRSFKRKLPDDEENSFGGVDGSCSRNDPDYQFLMSLLPHIKNVPLSKKLLLRMKIESTVHEFAYGDLTAKRSS